MVQAKDSSDSASQPSDGDVVLGIFVVVLGSDVNSIQNVIEEKILKGCDLVEPLELVGWEGVFGTLLSSLIMLPIVQHIPGDDCGCAEDTLNTLSQMRHSWLVSF